ncbi:MAG TPA: PaaI family thioesterase [Gaiellaceae bacterium]|nr:PaaI family thioesterase [Gaiellaceae bacterium]
MTDRIRASFAQQGMMSTIGAEIEQIGAGRVIIALRMHERLSQQHGFVHAGAVISALDSACGYAALTQLPDDTDVVTAELKVNLLGPAVGDRIVAEGEVVRAGRTLIVCRGDAYAERAGERTHVATMLASMVRRSPA